MPTGRPTLYREEFCEQARKLCLLGATDRELADFFGVVEDTIYEWKSRHAEFSESITRGKIRADAEVVDKLYHRALGYDHPAVKIFLPAGAIEPVCVPYTQHYPPDTQAASLWLRNRQGNRWRDRHEVDHTTRNVPVEEMTVEELTEIIRRGERERAAPPVGSAHGKPH